MNVTKITASKREASGKGGARRLRRTDRIPAVAYGQGISPLTLAVSPDAVLGVLSSEYGRNAVLELQVEGGDTLTVLLTDFQRHPVTRALLHADFVQIHADRPVDVDIPLVLTGKAEGVVQGGVLRQVYRRLPVRCLPKDIPASVSHDVTPLLIEDHVKASEIVLPAGVTMRLPPDQTVVAVAGAQKEEEVAADGATPAAGAAAPAEGEAAKTAAPAEKS